MNSDHLVQMKNLKFPPDLLKCPERKVACGDPAANNLKEGKHFSLYFVMCLEIVWYSQSSASRCAQKANTSHKC